MTVSPAIGRVGAAWRAARSVTPAGHLDAAGCNVPSDRVLDAVTGQLRRERELGGYRAAPDLTGARASLAALVDAEPGDVAFLESGTEAMAALLGGWRLGPGSRVGCTRAEYGSTFMLLRRLAMRRGWRLIELPLDGAGRLDPDGLRARLRSGLDLVVLSHVGSHHGVVQPAVEAGALCRAAGVPFVLDVCQSLGHVEVRGAGASAYVGTSRKWLAGPRGVGFLIVPGLTDTMDTPAPTLAGHIWNDPSGPWGEPAGSWGEPGRSGSDPSESWAESGKSWNSPMEPWGESPESWDGPAVGEASRPVPGAARFETSEAAVAARAGLGVAVREHHELGPPAVHAHLAELGRTARGLLDGAGGWRVAEPLDEPSALVTLSPPPDDTAARAAARATEASLLVGVVPVARAPLHLREPVLRVSPPPGTPVETFEALACALATH
ncbi:ergothioneine biosynthesis PLP-dependent enzyme EgtE [Nonomuraea fuscirosea]|uniref:ergothioneine biosynthesis PLP-dependent enzyme EgtE n=1 Tax=Nonomuraea fuscirosea TaxID=1291556 RepID=UPI00341F2307